jgi:hypothetical protein
MSFPRHTVYGSWHAADGIRLMAHGIRLMIYGTQLMTNDD